LRIFELMRMATHTW